MRWVLVPNWSKEPKTPYSTFNARAGTVAEKPAFRGLFRLRRPHSVTVTTEDAKYNQTAVENEANAWRARLAEVLPTLKGLDIGSKAMSCAAS